MPRRLTASLSGSNATLQKSWTSREGPELSAFFQPLVKVSRGAGCRVIDRNNLTILEEPGFENLHDFLAEHEVEIIASLLCYEPENVHKQRGQGVFDKSIRGLLKLNSVGYGCGKLPLHLVYNPVGASLPGPQAALEEDYRKTLKESHGVHFDRLLTLTNQPIARFAEDLRAQGQWEAYMELLTQAFNPDTLEGLMCRSTLNVGYQGDLLIATSIKCWGSTWLKKTHLSLGSGSGSTGPGCPSPPEPIASPVGRCGQQLHRSPHRMNPAPDRCPPRAFWWWAWSGGKRHTLPIGAAGNRSATASMRIIPRTLWVHLTARPGSRGWP